MKASELDKKFDDNQEAEHIGLSRQAVIKMWLAERLQSLNSKVSGI
jgi:hypothetical protein